MKKILRDFAISIILISAMAYTIYLRLLKFH